MTVDELRVLLADLPGEYNVVYPEYEAVGQGGDPAPLSVESVSVAKAWVSSVVVLSDGRTFTKCGYFLE